MSRPLPYLAIAVLAFVSAPAAIALADVGPAPSCPTGQQSAYYQGRYCAPVACNDDSACGSGAACVQRGLCIQARNAAEPEIGQQVVGECDAPSDCLGSSTCVQGKFCGPRPAGAAPVAAPTTTTTTTTTTPEPASTTSRDARDGCSVSPTSSPSMIGLVVLACILAAFRRERA